MTVHFQYSPFTNHISEVETCGCVCVCIYISPLLPLLWNYTLFLFTVGSSENVKVHEVLVECLRLCSEVRQQIKCLKFPNLPSEDK